MVTRREVFRIPWDASKILTKITSRVRLNTEAKITKTGILVALLGLLKSARINTKKVHSVDDIMAQLKEHIRRL